MLRYLVDANLPYYFALWQGKEYIYQRDIDPLMSDSLIWQYAKENGLTIITKDADFSDRILFHTPPPRIIHIKYGNLKLDEFYRLISINWKNISELSQNHKLVRVFKDRIEAIN
jgi:predicted nuclease of predicted toxin-antitoxin system